MLGETRCINFSGGIGVSEREAVGIFREFSLEELSAVINPHFSDARRIEWAIDAGSSRAHSTYLGHLRDVNPAAFLLGKIVDKNFPLYHLKAEFAGRFGRLLQLEGLEAEGAIQYMQELIPIQKALVLGLAAAFTFPEDRESVFTEELLITPHPRLILYQGEQIVRDVCDLSPFTGSLSVVNAVSDHLFVDYESALGRVVSDSGFLPTDLAGRDKTDQDFMSVHKKAGNILLEGTLLGAMLDHAHGGLNNVFRPEKNPNGSPRTPTRFKPRTTERGYCTGSSLVLNAIQAVGSVIGRNSQLISDVIESRLAAD